MEFFCDVNSLDGVLVDDPVLTFSAKDDMPIALLLVDTPALGPVAVVTAGKLAQACADHLERRDNVTCSGVLHNTTVMATDVTYGRQDPPRSVRHQRVSPGRRQR